MSLIGEVKEIADLAKQLGNLELHKRILALEGEIIGLTRENRSLQEENEQLTKRLKLKEQMRFEMPFYFVEGDDVPHCPTCWEVNHLAIHVSGPNKTISGGTFRSCKHCGGSFVSNRGENT